MGRSSQWNFLPWPIHSIPLPCKTHSFLKYPSRISTPKVNLEPGVECNRVSMFPGSLNDCVNRASSTVPPSGLRFMWSKITCIIFSSRELLVFCIRTVIIIYNAVRKSRNLDKTFPQTEPRINNCKRVMDIFIIHDKFTAVKVEYWGVGSRAHEDYELFRILLYDIFKMINISPKIGTPTVIVLLMISLLISPWGNKED